MRRRSQPDVRGTRRPFLSTFRAPQAMWLHPRSNASIGAAQGILHSPIFTLSCAADTRMALACLRTFSSPTLPAAGGRQLPRPRTQRAASQMRALDSRGPTLAMRPRAASVAMIMAKEKAYFSSVVARTCASHAAMFGACAYTTVGCIMREESGSVQAVVDARRGRQPQPPASS